jgi:pullulanase/glycogen debranching enzyme
MTSFFFAPENSLSSDGDGKIRGYSTAAVSEFKQMVKELHRHGITVLMDVVYNHTSLFDRNPQTHLCPHTYLRFNEKGQLMNRSGTGNEFRSEMPVARQLILDSLKHWVNEYHIDGFRFDLAALLDMETWAAIRKSLHEIDPRIVLIAEPWGGHYAPAKFSEYEWASWNDRIRNSFKGSDPQHDRGFIFSEWQHETSRARLENIIRGTLKQGDGGLFDTSAHSVNYLESHDGYTLADFIRIGLNPELQDLVIDNPLAFNKLNEQQLNHAKLAALSLFTAQGMTMIHAGQEFGRSKIIAETTADDPDIGKIDHNSYQKDNETNWLNFDVIDLNRELFSYYRGLIDIRLSSPALRKAAPEEISFDHFDNPLLLSFYITGTSSGDMYDYYVILNANWADTVKQNLPMGSWELIANKQIASSQAFNILSGQINVPAKSGVILRKFRH